MTKSLFSKQFLRVVWIWAYKVFERSSSSHHTNCSNLDLGLPVLIGVRVRPNSQFSNSELSLFSILRIIDRKCQRIQILRVSLITTAVMDKPPEKDDFKGTCQNRIHVCQSAPTWHTFRYGSKLVQDLHPGSVSIWASNMEGAVCKVSLGSTRCNIH